MGALANARVTRTLELAGIHRPMPPQLGTMCRTIGFVLPRAQANHRGHPAGKALIGLVVLYAQDEDSGTATPRRLLLGEPPLAKARGSGQG